MGDFFTDLFKYIFAQSIVLPLRAIAPISLLAFSALTCDYHYLITAHARSFSQVALLCYTAAEISFYIWFRNTLRRLQVRQMPPKQSRTRQLEIWKGIKENAVGNENPYAFLKAWFSVESLSQISRCDLKQWLAWALFDRQLDEIVSYDDKAFIDEIIVDGEKEFSIVIPNQKVAFLPDVMRLNIDPVQAQHRPLVYYAVTALMSFGSELILMQAGFRRYTVGPINYWLLRGDDHPHDVSHAIAKSSSWSPSTFFASQQFNQHESNNSTSSSQSQLEPPLVFVHGVGIGVAGYLPFLLQLKKRLHRYVCNGIEHHRTILLLELPHVSMRLDVDIVPRMDEIAECTAIAMARLNLPAALWVAHSLGTFVFAAINRLQPQLVAGVVMIDPVCFLLYEADLLRNFCYRQPKSPMQIIQHYHISRELSISYFFHRHFWWHECVQFPKDLPQKSLIYISEFDDIYNTGRVIAHLVKSAVQVRILKGTSHGGWLLDSDMTKTLIDSMSIGKI